MNAVYILLICVVVAGIVFASVVLGITLGAYLEKDSIEKMVKEEVGIDLELLKRIHKSANEEEE